MKTSYIGLIFFGVLTVYAGYLKYDNAQLKSNIELLQRDYSLSESENKKLKLLVDENNRIFQSTIEELNNQITAERELSNQVIDQYKSKIDILKKAKSVDPKDTTGVLDQDSSKLFIDRTNNLVDIFNKKSKSRSF